MVILSRCITSVGTWMLRMTLAGAIKTTTAGPAGIANDAFLLQTKRDGVSLSTAKSVGPTTVVQTGAVTDPVLFRKEAAGQFCRGQQGS